MISGGQLEMKVLAKRKHFCARPRLRSEQSAWRKRERNAGLKSVSFYSGML